MLRPDEGADNPRRTAGRIEGRRLKASNLAVLDARRARHLVAARRVLLTVLLDRGKGSADDWRDVVTLPDGIDPVCFGAVPKPFALAGIIRRAGFIKTSRPVAHARPVSVWELVDPEAARLWLAKHHDSSAVANSPPAALELPKRTAEGLAPIDAVAETSPATLPSDFGRNDRPADVASPGEPSPARVQRLLFDGDSVEGCSHAA